MTDLFIIIGNRLVRKKIGYLICVKNKKKFTKKLFRFCIPFKILGNWHAVEKEFIFPKALLTAQQELGIMITGLCIPHRYTVQPELRENL